MTIKRITFVLHIPKTGGSSFWLDLAESASGNPKIAITDSQHEALSRGEPLSSAWGHTIRMVNGFARIEQRHLLMHVHYPMGNFKVIAPQAQYVVLFREPRARLRSAYRHWMGEQSARTKTPNPMEFFQAFHSQGLNYYLSRLVSDTDQWYSEPSSELIKFLRKSFIFISFNEYINNGDKKIFQ